MRTVASWEAELSQRGVAFIPIDVISNPQARPLMNRIGKQDIPTTIVGTYVVTGCDPDGVEQALLIEQKSLKWPVLSPAAAARLTSPASAHPVKAVKRGHEHARSHPN